jgi:hypothetical protein
MTDLTLLTIGCRRQARMIGFQLGFQLWLLAINMFLRNDQEARDGAVQCQPDRPVVQ